MRDTWIAVQVGNVFDIGAPTGTVFLPGAGIDSIVGALTGPGFALQIDYGRFSDPLTAHPTLSDVEVIETQLEGRRATIVTGRVPAPVDGRPFFAGLHVPVVSPTPRGALRLTLAGTVQDERERSMVLRMFATIRFKPRP